MGVMAVRFKTLMGGFGLLLWHLMMNTGVFLEGWYGGGVAGWLACQVAGIPFYIDHLFRLVLLTGLYETTKRVAAHCRYGVPRFS